MNRLISLFAILSILIGSSACKRGKTDVVNPQINDDFSRNIAAYTDGVVSVKSNIQIVFTREFASKLNKKSKGPLFSFKPSIKGTAEWMDEVTLVFKPSAPLLPKTEYTGSVNIGKMAEVGKDFSSFPLKFSTLSQNFTVTAYPVQVDLPDGNLCSFEGILCTSDFIESATVEKFLSIKYDNRKITPKWTHLPDNNHIFIVKGLERGDTDKKAVLSWNGSPSGIKSKGRKEITVPALGTFSVMDVSVEHNTKSLTIYFSDILDAGQDMDGLIWFSDNTPLKLSVKGNVVTVVPEKDIYGEVSVCVSEAVRNVRNEKLGSEFREKVQISSPLKPGLKAVKTGAVMPSSNKFVYQFMAANLSHVDLTIIKIYADNLPWFLRYNLIGDPMYGDDLQRFGRPVYHGTLDLATDQNINHNEYSLFSINLADYIEVEKGALYRLEFDMRPSYSLYPCDKDFDSGKSVYEKKLDIFDVDREWDDLSYYSNKRIQLFYEYAYNWKERNDPCKEAYYSPDNSLVQNILVSDLGIMAKYGDDQSLLVFVTNLLDSKPITGVSVDVYDNQMQLIASQSTNHKGVASVHCEHKPYLVIARQGSNRNYLSLKDGESLSMSAFDIAGESAVDGLKAFLFTERDVRRPGDTIYVGLIAKEMNNRLPEGHPVVFELYNPAGQVVAEQTARLNREGFHVFTTTTKNDAPTGNYRALVKIGGAVFSKTIKVETVKPNRLKVHVVYPSETVGGEDKTLSGQLKVSWLNGSTARNLKTTVNVLFKPVEKPFKNFPQYIFNDPVDDFSYPAQEILNSTLDSEGQVSFKYSPDKYFSSPGMLTAQLTVRVMEKGGNESIVTSSVPYAPFSVFAGINIPALDSGDGILYTGKDNEVKIVTVDKNGKKVDSKAVVRVYKLDYKWWWEYDDKYLAQYVSGDGKNIVTTETVSTVNGEASVKLTFNKEKWGRYLIRVTLPSGHTTGAVVFADTPYEYGNRQGGTDDAALLRLSSDKEKYTVGENIRISFPSSPNATAIITLEDHHSIIDIIEKTTGADKTTVTFTATPEMSPNIYAYVTLVQPHSQTFNDSPIRMYGVIPIYVENKDSHLMPTIDMPDKIRSQKEFVIKVSEQKKRSMTYTLAVVDEGLLDLTGFKTPDPWKWYYSRQTLGIKTWDMFNDVFGAYGTALSQVFAVGGDMALLDQSKNKTRRFEPVVKFMGPFTLGKGKTAQHKLHLPDYSGSVRVMVVAADDANRFGSCEKRVTVADPLMVIATAPRVLSPGDAVVLPVSVFANDKSIDHVSVRVESNDMLSFKEDKTSLLFAEPGEQDVNFRFKVAGRTGKAEIKVTVAGQGQTATCKLNVEVRSPNPVERRSFTEKIDPANEFTRKFIPFGMTNTSKAVIELFSLPSMNLSHRLSWLTQYPHGCTEQVTSAAFPQIYLSAILDSSLVKNSDVREKVQEAVRILNTRQLSNGALACWPKTVYPDDWVTSYAGHFILEAKNAGYVIPGDFLKKWLSYQKKQSAAWIYREQYRYTANDQAYRLFTLALAGAPDRGAMNRLREVSDLPAVSRWMLAAAYAAIGRKDAAMELIDVRNLHIDNELSDYYYGSELRDMSIILYTLAILDNHIESVELLKEISKRFSSEEWISTQTTAWGLFAYETFIKKLGADGSHKISASVNINGKRENVTSEGAAVTREFIPAESNKITVNNTGDAPLFVTLTEYGVAKKSDKTAYESNLTMKVNYVDMDMDEIDVSSLPQSTEFMMVVDIANPTVRRIEDLALNIMVPAGWEIQNTRLFETKGSFQESSCDYRDFRDDKVLTYFSLNGMEQKKYAVLLTASYIGEYMAPAVVCEAMYDNRIIARKPGQKVVVVEQK